MKQEQYKFARNYFHPSLCFFKKGEQVRIGNTKVTEEVEYKVNYILALVDGKMSMVFNFQRFNLQR